jgi:hypothetical protein
MPRERKRIPLIAASYKWRVDAHQHTADDSPLLNQETGAIHKGCAVAQSVIFLYATLCFPWGTPWRASLRHCPCARRSKSRMAAGTSGIKAEDVLRFRSMLRRILQYGFCAIHLFPYLTTRIMMSET